MNIVRIEGPEYLFEDKIPYGSGTISNPVLPDIEYLVRRGVGATLLKTDVQNGKAIVDGISDYRKLTPQKVAGLVQLGCEVFGYPGWVKLPLASTSGLVPEYLTHPNKSNDLGEQLERKTWAEWGINKRDTADFSYIELNSAGVWEKGTVITQLIMGGYTIMNTGQVIADLPVDDENLL